MNHLLVLNVFLFSFLVQENIDAPLNRKERLLFPSLPGTNRATFTAVRSRISLPFRAALKEKWESGLNPWCMLFDAIFSF
jgi:hypothetical protein